MQKTPFIMVRSIGPKSKMTLCILFLHVIVLLFFAVLQRSTFLLEIHNGCHTFIDVINCASVFNLACFAHLQLLRLLAFWCFYHQFPYKLHSWTGKSIWK